jgi:hypothetical protein
MTSAVENYLSGLRNVDPVLIGELRNILTGNSADPLADLDAVARAAKRPRAVDPIEERTLSKRWLAAPPALSRGCFLHRPA